MRKTCLFILICVGIRGFCQNSDSLKLSLKNAEHDTTRCRILNEMIEAEGDPSVWIKYNTELKELTEKNAEAVGKLKNVYLKYLAIAYGNVGYFWEAEHDLDKQLDLFNKSLKISEEIGDRKAAAMTLNSIASVYYDKSEIPKALEYYKKSGTISESIGDKKGLAASLNGIALIYDKQGDIQNALDFHHRSLKMKEEAGDEEGLALSLNNIGFIYNYQGESAKALEYFTRALDIYERLGNLYGIGLCLNNVASAYKEQGNKPKAVEYLLRSLKIKEDAGDKEGLAYSFSNLGTVYESEGDVVKAMEHYEKSLKIREAIGDKAGMSNSLCNIANLLFDLGKTEKALLFGNRAMAVSKEVGFPFLLLNSAETLKRVFQKLNRHKEAFEMYELELKMRDSITSQKTRKAAVRKQLQYAYEKKEAVANAEHKVQLEKQQAIADEKQRKQNIVIWSVGVGLILVVGFAGYVFKTLRLTRKQKSLIETKSRQVEEKQTEILDSIQYAKRIQRAQMPSEVYISKNLTRLKSKA